MYNDHEQALIVMTTLSMFAFKTCLKFVPVMTAPEVNQHVMSFVNPEEKRRCQIKNEGHENEKPHEVILGYECLQSPNIDMMVMRALGFPFEHNRADRDLHIEVLEENIEPGYIELYTKDPKLPNDLSSLPYDVNSVMHFGVRDYSKNGHRTIIFKVLVKSETFELVLDSDSTKPENIVTDIKGKINSTSEKVDSDVIEAKKDTLVNNFNDVKAEDFKHEDILRIVAAINDFAKAMVDNALRNLTEFCSSSKSVEFYQRAGCSWNDGSDRCRQTYRSTKSGPVRHLTQHRPVYIQSTKHDRRGLPKNFVHFGRRASETNQTTEARRKRSADTANT
ncbi:hypothetical protein K1T71_014887 [Dendrolimus kikuchii]|nr:hypothetical protein K1T71_014887 [Dendrolimus kikuchii]